jgi:hypothetical protein
MPRYRSTWLLPLVAALALAGCGKKDGGGSGGGGDGTGSADREEARKRLEKIGAVFAKGSYPPGPSRRTASTA